MNIHLILKLLAVVSFGALRAYWWIAEKRAYRNLPPTTKRRYRLMRIFLVFQVVFILLIGVYLFDIPLLTFEPNVASYLLGFALFCAGFALTIAGRKALGDNWTHMVDYQIKAKQALVTHGIFAYIRHPMYSGFIAIFTGLFIIMASWLWIPILLGLILFFFGQCKKEEYLLARHFGKDYLRYVHRTKMLLPWVF